MLNWPSQHSISSVTSNKFTNKCHDPIKLLFHFIILLCIFVKWVCTLCVMWLVLCKILFNNTSKNIAGFHWAVTKFRACRGNLSSKNKKFKAYRLLYIDLTMMTVDTKKSQWVKNAYWEKATRLTDLFKKIKLSYQGFSCFWNTLVAAECDITCNKSEFKLFPTIYYVKNCTPKEYYVQILCTFVGLFSIPWNHAQERL